MKLQIECQSIIDGIPWNLGRPILEAHRIGGCVVIIFDYMSYPKSQQAKNLVAYDPSQKLLWIAEHPTDDIIDTYVHLLSEVPLKVFNFASYTCEIDVQTGKLQKAIFTK